MKVLAPRDRPASHGASAAASRAPAPAPGSMDAEKGKIGIPKKRRDKGPCLRLSIGFVEAFYRLC